MSTTADSELVWTSGANSAAADSFRYIDDEPAFERPGLPYSQHTAEHLLILIKQVGVIQVHCRQVCSPSCKAKLLLQTADITSDSHNRMTAITISFTTYI